MTSREVLQLLVLPTRILPSGFNESTLRHTREISKHFFHKSNGMYTICGNLKEKCAGGERKAVEEKVREGKGGRRAMFYFVYHSSCTTFIFIFSSLLPPFLRLFFSRNVMRFPSISAFSIVRRRMPLAFHVGTERREREKSEK